MHVVATRKSVAPGALVCENKRSETVTARQAAFLDLGAVQHRFGKGAEKACIWAEWAWGVYGEYAMAQPSNSSWPVACSQRTMPMFYTPDLASQGSGG